MRSAGRSENAPVELWDRAEIPQEERKAFYRKAFSADFYLMSANAVTLDGQLVNIDGTGNRVAALSYGPDCVILLVGMNKIVPDLDAAIARVHNIAAPPNAIRLGLSTPCAKDGRLSQLLLPGKNMQHAACSALQPFPGTHPGHPGRRIPRLLKILCPVECPDFNNILYGGTSVFCKHSVRRTPGFRKYCAGADKMPRHHSIFKSL